MMEAFHETYQNPIDVPLGGPPVGGSAIIRPNEARSLVKAQQNDLEQQEERQLQIGDRVLFHPRTSGERSDRGFAKVGIFVGEHKTHKNLVHITKERDEVSSAVPAYDRNDLSRSRVGGFEWEFGAHEHDMFLTANHYRTQASWKLLK